MNDQKTPSTASEERKMLEESERAAFRKQPRNFREEAAESTVVELYPDADGVSSITDLDAKDAKSQKGDLGR